MVSSARILVWADLSGEDVADLSSLTQHSDVVQFISQKLTVDRSKYSEAQLDVLYSTVALSIPFSRSMRMDASQTSTLVSIVKNILLTTTESNMTMEDAYEYAKAVLVRHSVFRPPFSTNVFPLDHTVSIQEFLLNKIFRFYKMFFFVFGKNEEVDFSVVERSTSESVPVFLPLNDFIPEEQHIAAVQAQEAAQRIAEQEAADKEAAEKSAEEARRRAEEDARIAEEHSKTVTVAEMNSHIQALRGELGTLTAQQMDALEAKLRALESRLGLPQSVV
eukprot:ANDGO_02003.mRNA.1 flagellar associated protein